MQTCHGASGRASNVGAAAAPLRSAPGRLTGAVRVRAFTQERAAISSRLPTAPRELLRELGHVGDDTYNRANRLHNGVLEHPRDAARLLPVLSQLMAACSLSSHDLQRILLRHPQVFDSPPDDVAEVLAFLQQDLHLDDERLTHVITRFPCVFSYSVKAHLKPQVAYLESLGVEREQLGDYVVARPLLLGEGIETVIKFLRACRVPRRQMGQLLRTFPIDYCCRFIIPTSQEAAPDQ